MAFTEVNPIATTFSLITNATTTFTEVGISG